MSCRALHEWTKQSNILQTSLIKESLWLGRRSATESLECFQKAAELCTFWVSQLCSLHSITEAYAGWWSPTGTFAREGWCRGREDNASMHTALARDACRGTLGIQYDGEDGVQRLSRHDRSLLLVARCAKAPHVGLMVLVADRCAVQTDPSMSARSWIT